MLPASVSPVVDLGFRTVERFFGKTRFHLEKKVRRFEEMLEDRFDFERLDAALELGSD